jgi:hypothetical protein
MLQRVPRDLLTAQENEALDVGARHRPKRLTRSQGALQEVSDRVRMMLAGGCAQAANVDEILAVLLAQLRESIAGLLRPQPTARQQEALEDAMCPGKPIVARPRRALHAEYSMKLCRRIHARRPDPGKPAQDVNHAAQVLLNNKWCIALGDKPGTKLCQFLAI